MTKPSAGSSWRDREAAKKATVVGDSSSPANGETDASKAPTEADEEGFQTVPKRQNVWRARGRGT